MPFLARYVALVDRFRRPAPRFAGTTPRSLSRSTTALCAMSKARPIRRALSPLWYDAQATPASCRYGAILLFCEQTPPLYAHALPPAHSDPPVAWLSPRQSWRDALPGPDITHDLGGIFVRARLVPPLSPRQILRRSFTEMVVDTDAEDILCD